LPSTSCTSSLLSTTTTVSPTVYMPPPTLTSSPSLSVFTSAYDDPQVDPFEVSNPTPSASVPATTSCTSSAALPTVTERYISNNADVQNDEEPVRVSGSAPLPPSIYPEKSTVNNAISNYGNGPSTTSTTPVLPPSALTPIFAPVLISPNNQMDNSELLRLLLNLERQLNELEARQVAYLARMRRRLAKASRIRSKRCRLRKMLS
jgi:hypothetical protein